MSKCINHIQYTDSIGMSECKDGFWLYDKTRGLNLAMHAKTEQAAFIEALEYYQKRLALRSKVEGFVNLFVSEVDYGSSSDIPNTVLEINI